MSGYIIYHPKRNREIFDGTTVYYDNNEGNQDPYVWNRQFLHTYCHMTQMTPQEGQINFWVSGDTFPNFSQLFCDLVFVVQSKSYWADSNHIERKDPLVDSTAAFNDHYGWAMHQHGFKRRRRFTLKANGERSFQPQTADGGLLDIVSALEDVGISLDVLRTKLRAGFNSRPMRLSDNEVTGLKEWMETNAPRKLVGAYLEAIRRKNPQLASKLPDGESPRC